MVNTNMNTNTNMSLNPMLNNASYLREMYGDRQGEGDSSSRVQQRVIEQQNDRDTLFLSAEALRTRSVDQALNVNGNTLDQQGAIIRPGLEQTVLRSEASLEPPPPARPGGEEVSPPAGPAEPEAISPREGIAVEARPPAGPPATEPVAPRAGEETSIFESRQDLSAGPASINALNSSTMVQAYAAAANFNQASYVVNYKV